MRRWLLGFLAAVACAVQAADANFHLYLLIGQSNMAGRGKIALEDKVAVPRVLMYPNIFPIPSYAAFR